MIEAKVPKDIRVYETKFVGPLTVRNTVCLVIAGIVVYLTYNICCGLLGMSLNSFFYVGIFTAMPPLAFGWVSIEGMHLETYIKKIVIYNYLVPAYRKPKKIIYKYKAEKKNPLSSKELKRRKKILDNDPQYKKYL